MRYDERTFKGTHNSYLREWGMSLSEQLDYHRSRPELRPVESVELDLFQMPGGAGFYVSHDRRQAGSRVEWYLDDLRRWSEANPGHTVITVILDLKLVREVTAVASEVDAVIRGSGLQTVRPADILQSRFATLREALVADGWPDVSAFAGRFLFVVSGRWAHEYVHGGDVPLEELQAFSSHDWRSLAAAEAAWMNEDPWRVFVNVGYWDRKRHAALAARRKLLAPHMVLRTWGGTSERDFENAQSLDVNIVAVDRIELSGRMDSEQPSDQGPTL
jgi:hypothetical protein